MSSRFLALTALLLATVCSYKAGAQEFETIAQALEQSSHPILGTHQVEALTAKLAHPGQTVQQRTRTRSLLAFHQLRLGQTLESMTTMERVLTEHQEQSSKPPPVSLLKMQAMILLRQAEVANCIQRHTADCCLFPLANGGIHSDKSPARQALAILKQILKESPSDRLSQWLLNIAAMAIGEFPNAVPQQFRIPDSILTRTAPVGQFVDVAPTRGLDAFNLCGGVAVADFNRDGRFDIISSTFDPSEPLIYYQQQDDDQYKLAGSHSRLDNQLGGLNLVSADYDNDGDTDLFVLRGAWLGESGRIRNSLLRNDGPASPGSAASFTDVTRDAGLAKPAYPSQTAAWGDFDSDGDLDLYVGNESLKSVGNANSNFPNQLFINDGRGKFQDHAAIAGVTNDRFCKGVASGDYDNDGDLDLYVSNAGVNRLYRNDGGLRFTDVAETLGVSEPADRSFATWFFDYNNDGWLDLFVAGFKATPADLLADYRGEAHDATFPKLYQNTGDGRFNDVTRAAGLEHVYLPMGANFGDVDFDGWLDIYLATGDPQFETLMPNVLLRNIEGKRFEDVTVAAGLGHLQKGHGVAFVDLDNDGDQDLYHQLGGFYPGDKYHNALFLNPGNEHHHLYVTLTGTKTNRDAIGAKITVTARTPTGTRNIHRRVGIVSSFGGSPLRQELGLGNATTIEEVIVHWPISGELSRFDNVPLDASIAITEGEDHFTVLD
jgi:hypothetical protein